MCGIAGRIYFGSSQINRDEEIAVIKGTIQKLKHRGPDEDGYFIDKKVWLASTRLSIIDLSHKADQPISNEDGSIKLVFNGEIYNYKELKSKFLKKHKFRSESDSEVLIHLYEEFGYECLKYLRGMFAFAIWDGRKKILFLARDRLGKKPLKYFANSKFFVFASELKAFVKLPEIPYQMDYSAVNDYLDYGYVPYPKTGFKNIFKLPPATFMVIDRMGKYYQRKYWDTDFTRKLDLSEEEWVKKTEDKIEESVRLRLRSDVPVGVHLSGGIDSALVTAIAAVNSKNKLKTFCVGFDDDKSDFYYAGLLAKKYKTEHTEIVVKADFDEVLSEMAFSFEEPYGDPSAVPTYFLMKETGKHLKVALNGEGGDENFAGYPRYIFLKNSELLKKIPGIGISAPIFKFLFKIFGRKDFYILSKYFSLLNRDGNQYYENLMRISDSAEYRMRKSEKSNYIRKIMEKAGDLSYLDKIIYADLHSYLPGQLLVKTDILAMRHSVEVRSPFLDQELLEMTAQMPENMKIKNFRKSKYMLKKIASKYISEEIIRRRKKGFLPPLNIWLKRSIKNGLMDNLNSSNGSYGFFKNGYIKRLLSDHSQRVKDNSYEIWSILMLFKWMERWH